MFKAIATQPFHQPGGSFGSETAKISSCVPDRELRGGFFHRPYITVIHRTDDINNIESEGRYRYSAVPCRTGNETNERLLQEDTAAALRPLVILSPRATNQNTQPYVHLTI